MVDDWGWSILGHTNANLPSCVIKHGWLESTKWSLLAGNSSIFSWHFPLPPEGVWDPKNWRDSPKLILIPKIVQHYPLDIFHCYPIQSHPIPSWSFPHPIETWQEPLMENRWIRWLCLSMFFFSPLFWYRDNDDSPWTIGVFHGFSTIFRPRHHEIHETRWQTRQNNKRSAMRQKIQGHPSGGLRLGVC